jgi:cytochrome c oxidase subunit 3
MVLEGKKKGVHPHKFTLWVAMASIIMMFAGLTSAYIVKSNLPNWEVVETPKEFWYSTITILMSSVTIQWALFAFKQREMNKYRMMMAITGVLGLVFIVLQYLGFSWMWENGVRLQGSGAGQFLYIIAGLHGLHVLGGIIALLIVILRAYIGRTIQYNSLSVELMSTYWHFVDILWIYLFIFFIIIK